MVLWGGGQKLEKSRYLLVIFKNSQGTKGTKRVFHDFFDFFCITRIFLPFFQRYWEQKSGIRRAHAHAQTTSRAHTPALGVLHTPGECYTLLASKRALLVIFFYPHGGVKKHYTPWHFLNFLSFRVRRVRRLGGRILQSRTRVRV